jgi:hypothetical protein
MRNLIKVAIIATGAFVFASCGTSKLTQKDSLKVHSESKEQSETNTVKTTETKAYGDTLKGTSFIPFTASSDSASNEIHKGTVPNNRPDTGYTITGESGGIKFKATITRTYDNGKLSGVKADYTAIAKPKTTTDTREVQAAKVRKTTKVDSTKKEQSKKDTKIGFSLPSWGWLVIVIAAIVAVLFVKPIFNKLKSWISIF